MKIAIILSALTLSCLSFTTGFAQEIPVTDTLQTAPELVKHRPKIGVVLAGGGAKGVAHVAALKAIEDAGIPIDIVVGTSIGSIIGGLYCTGYSPDTMKQIIGGTDWVKMISDNPDFDGSTLSGKKDNENYQLRFKVDPLFRKSSTGKGGIIQGSNVITFFQSLTTSLPDSLDFSDMPVPFACVGTEAVSGKCKVFTSGNLPLSMRASMAIPSVFTPVTIDSIVYVDGGVVDNFPVDIARQLGADIVIGVDLKVNTTNEELTNSAIDLLMNCIDFYSKERYQENVKDADIYIPIDVTGYSAASFGAAALDTLMNRGEYYSSLKKAELDSLAATLHLEEPPTRIRIGEYSFANTKDGGSSWEESATASLYEANGGSLSSSINLGGRIDDREYASILAKLNLVVSQKHGSLLQVRARIGQRLELKTDYSLKTFGSQRMGFNWKIQRYDIEMNNKGVKHLDFNMVHNKFNLYFTQEWHKVKYTFGLNYNIFHDSDILSDLEFSDVISEAVKTNRSFTENYFSYYIESEYNSFNRQYFPTKGEKIVIGADLITDNLYQYNSKTPFPIFSASWQSAISFTSRLTCIPHLTGRAILTKDLSDKPIACYNMIGGLFTDMHFVQQDVFAGVSELEMLLVKGYAIGGLTFQHNLLKNHYIVATADVMSHTNSFQDVFKSESLNWGVEASYNIRTSIGPLSIKGFYSNLSDKFRISVNAGYYF